MKKSMVTLKKLFLFSNMNFVFYSTILSILKKSQVNVDTYAVRATSLFPCSP